MHAIDKGCVKVVRVFLEHPSFVASMATKVGSGWKEGDGWMSRWVSEWVGG